MIDDNVKLIDAVKEYFKNNEEVKVVLEAYNGLEGMEIIKEWLDWIYALLITVSGILKELLLYIENTLRHSPPLEHFGAITAAITGVLVARYRRIDFFGTRFEKRSNKDMFYYSTNMNTSYYKGPESYHFLFEHKLHYLKHAL